MKFFLPLAIVVAFCFDYQNDIFWPPWVALAVIIQIALTWRLITEGKIPVTGAILFGWCVLSGILFMSWRPFTQLLEFDAKAAIRLCAAQALAEFLLLSGLFYTQWRNIRAPVAIGLWAGGLLHAIFLIIDQTLPRLIQGIPEALFATKGLLGNRSIGASFTCVWIYFSLYLTSIYGIPEHFKKLNFMRITSIVIGVTAVLISVSSISFGALILAAFCMFLAGFWKLFKPWDVIKWSLLAAAFFGSLGFFLGPYIDHEWGKHISRQDAWPLFLKYYVDHISLLIGSGAGTFKYYGPLIQDLNQFQVGRWWLWAHNDWLQILFEYGIIGLALATGFFLVLLRMAFARPLLFAALISYGVTMAGNYPLHIAMTALLGFWLVFETMWGKHDRHF